MPEHERKKKVINAKALGIARYGQAMYAGQTEAVKNQTNTVFMRANRRGAPNTPNAQYS